MFFHSLGSVVIYWLIEFRPVMKRISIAVHYLDYWRVDQSHNTSYELSEVSLVLGSL
jgi:hypothetical protein